MIWVIIGVAIITTVSVLMLFMLDDYLKEAVDTLKEARRALRDIQYSAEAGTLSLQKLVRLVEKGE